MAGIFPIAGVVAQQTLNAAFPISTAEGCDALYYRANCRPMFDPVATNALISELVNAINVTQPYDCSRLDNLKQTLAKIQNLCTLPNATPAQIVDSALAGCFNGGAAKISFPELKEAILDICEWEEAAAFALTDTVAGCFGGRRRTITLGNLRSVLIRLCELAVVTSATATDTLAGCFNGQNGRISVDNLSQVIGGGHYRPGSRFATLGLGTSLQANVGQRTAFCVVSWTSPDPPIQIPFGMGVPNSIGIIPWGAGSFNPGGVSLLFNTGRGGDAGMNPVLVVKKGGTWWAVQDGFGVPIGSSNVAMCPAANGGHWLFEATPI